LKISLPVAANRRSTDEDGHDPKTFTVVKAALEKWARAFDLMCSMFACLALMVSTVRAHCRSNFAVAYLLLTGRSAVEDRVNRLAAGADDIYRSHLPCVNSLRASARLGRRYPEEQAICLP